MDFKHHLRYNLRLNQILKLLAAQQLSTVIVMCSAYDTADNFEKARSIGMLDVITKPVRK
jgi:CheY-like chemotaxis protein